MGSHIQLENVTVKFPRVAALTNIDLEMSPGESVALVGSSGAGKTSLLNVCNGMLIPDSGRVLINGTDLVEASPRTLKQTRTNIGFIHQNLSLIPNLRVIQNVVCGGFGRRTLLGSARDLLFPSRSVTERVYEILESVGIPEKLYARTDSLSGGQQQRVAIARAVFQAPQVLLADEPVSSVDPKRAEATVSLLQQISSDHGLTLCVSLHNLALARSHFPRLVAMRSGRIVFDKPSAETTDADFDAVYRLDTMDNQSGEQPATDQHPGGRFA